MANNSSKINIYSCDEAMCGTEHICHLLTVNNIKKGKHIITKNKTLNRLNGILEVLNIKY